MSTDMEYTLLHIQILRDLSSKPSANQRWLAEKNGISIGKVNYIIKSLAEKGLIKLNRFRNSKNKSAYLYILTPEGLRLKTEATREFLRIKMQEYDRLQAEIKEIQKDLEDSNLTTQTPY